MARKKFSITTEVERGEDANSFVVKARGPRCSRGPKDTVELPDGVCGVVRVVKTSNGPQVQRLVAYRGRGVTTALLKRAAEEACSTMDAPLAADAYTGVLGQGFWETHEKKGNAAVEWKDSVDGKTKLYKLKCPVGDLKGGR
ncbi:MAG: hypothetical protein KGI71_05090 [Patescibacteria group bacterium]|nr:hypothetical protein [Patescibacteria group bacterium]